MLNKNQFRWFFHRPLCYICIAGSAVLILLTLFTDLFAIKIPKEGLVQTVTVEVVENRFAATDTMLTGKAMLFNKPTTVSVSFSKQANTFRAGDNITFEASVYTEKSTWYKSGGVKYRLYPKGEIVFNGSNDSIWCHWPTYFREYVFDAIQSIYGDGKQGALLKAMMTGNKDGLSAQDKNTFSAAGISHIMAVSGLHMSILLGFCTLAMGKRGGIYIGLPLLLIYGAISGFSPSTVRAIIMVCFVSVTFLIHREYDIITAFSVALFAEVAWNPFVIYSMSFILSFLSVLGIISIMPKMIKAIEQVTQNHKKPYMKYLLSSAALSFSASVFTTPVVAYQFERVSLISVVCNLFAVPLGTLALLLGMISVVLYGLVPGIAILFGQWIIAPLLSSILWLASAFTALPLSSLQGGVWYIVAFFICLSVGMVLWRVVGRGKLIFPVLLLAFLLCIGGQWYEKQYFDTITIQMAKDVPLAYIQSGDSAIALGAGEGADNFAGPSFYQKQQFRYEQEGIDSLFLGKMNKGNVTGALSLLNEVQIKQVYGSTYQRELYGLSYETLSKPVIIGSVKVTPFLLQYSEAIFLLEFSKDKVLWCPTVAPKRLTEFLQQNTVQYDIAIISGEQLLDSKCFSALSAEKTIVADTKAADWLGQDGLIQIAGQKSYTLKLAK